MVFVGQFDFVFLKYFNFESMKAVLVCLQASGSGKTKKFDRKSVRKTMKNTINSICFSANKSFK